MAEKLKNIFFTKSFIENLSKAIQSKYTEFDRDKFFSYIFDDDWEKRELKDRMRHISRCLHETLPDQYPEALNILLDIAPGFKGFDAMIFPDFVECYGMDHWDLSLPALGEFTKCCSSEFAIRPFLNHDPNTTMKYLHLWAEDKDDRVRRLASEGCRPRLPWAMALPKFKKDPELIIPILEKLKNDESESVRRSVANNLNDISKDNPDLVLDICEIWYGVSENINWIVKHASRDMLKAGNTKAMRLFGFGDPKNFIIENFNFQQEMVHIGEDLTYSFDLIVKSKEMSKIRLELAVRYVKAKGKLSSKIFQIRENSYKPGRHKIVRKHSFINFSTRTHYPGEHKMSIIVNGVVKAEKSLQVLNPLKT